MPTAYPEQIRRLQDLLTQYRANRLSITDLQTAIVEASDFVASYEDRELRKSLLWAEGKLDALEYTTEFHDLPAAVLEIIAVVEDAIAKVLRQ